ncbi:Maf family protein [Bosea sp. (in: a-proteobacteria)]|uniref:Maf family protein n=1 Tax=Bosea sp. (in: a-proteobacteria) TaxID=1871050 RepID=UPI002FC8EDF5
MSAPATFWRGDQALLLASGSATRKSMLQGAGLPVESIPPEIDERAVEAGFLASGGDAPGVAAALAAAKALAVSAQAPGRWVLGADQTLTCEGTAFHKPEDENAAVLQIAALSGRRHELTSAFALARDGAVIRTGMRRARLVMRRLDAGFIEHYVAQAGPAATGSVGGYQIEGLGAQLFGRIDGDYFTILGLPLLDLLAVLRELDLLA